MVSPSTLFPSPFDWLFGYLSHVISCFMDVVDFILMSFNMFPLPSVLPVNGQLDLEACSGENFGNRCFVLPKHLTKRCYLLISEFRLLSSGPISYNGSHKLFSHLNR